MPPRGEPNDLERTAEDDSSTECNVLKLDVANQRPISEARRYGLLTLASFAMICASTSYAFNLFSGSLRDRYNFDSRQMSTINTVGMVFAYFLLPYGTIYDYLGPLPVYILACVLASLGRLTMSVFEHYTQKRKAEDRMPITVAFFVPTTLIILSMALFLVLPGRSLLAAFALASLGNGFCASITILVLRTMYAKDPARHYNFGYNALWIAAILLNRLLYGEWIASRADRQGQKVCVGRECVMMPLLVMIGMNLTALLSDVYLHISYSRFSRRVLAERRRLREGAAAAGSSEPMCPEKGEAGRAEERIERGVSEQTGGHER